MAKLRVHDQPRLVREVFFDNGFTFRSFDGMGIRHGRKFCQNRPPATI